MEREDWEREGERTEGEKEWERSERMEEKGKKRVRDNSTMDEKRTSREGERGRGVYQHKK